MRVFLAAAATSLGLALQAGASVLTNGGFETGDFTGWTEVSAAGGSSCNRDWIVDTSGPSCEGFEVGTAGTGDFSAFNSFDGDGPKSFTIEQDIALTADPIVSATLGWQHSVNWTMRSDAESRVFSLFFLDAADDLIGEVFSLVIDPSQQNTGSIDWTDNNLDVTGLLGSRGGQTVTLVANVFIPQIFTGPAGFGLDEVTLEIETTAIPVPASVWLLGTAFAGLLGHRRLSRRRLRS